MVSGVLKRLCAIRKYCETSPTWDFAVIHLCWTEVDLDANYEEKGFLRNVIANSRDIALKANKNGFTYHFSYNVCIQTMNVFISHLPKHFYNLPSHITLPPPVPVIRVSVCA